jgi:hypothetical protein
VPVTFSIDNHHVRLVCKGDYTVDELIRTSDKAFSHPAYSYKLKTVLDLRGIEGTRTPADLQRVVDHLIEKRLRHHTENAVLVTDSFRFGMARMAQNYAESQADSSFEIFKTEEELQNWLTSR